MEAEFRFLQDHHYGVTEDLRKVQARILSLQAAIAAEKCGAKNLMNPTQPRKIQWLAGWYASVLHAYDGPVTTNPRHELDAVCGNGVFLIPRTDEVARRLAKGNVPRCKKCERIVASMEVKP